MWTVFLVELDPVFASKNHVPFHTMTSRDGGGNAQRIALPPKNAQRESDTIKNQCSICSGSPQVTCLWMEAPLGLGE